MSDTTKELSIYFHWPFCKSKCPYCDFFSLVKKSIDQDNIISGYVEQLNRYQKMLGQRKINSIFFGGGTPSLISPKNIEKILNTINHLWGIDNTCEISLEANPNTHSPTLFHDLSQVGINRLSLGVQSLDDNELKFLGRTHNSTQALKAIDDVLKNFSNHSVDLMYALPDQQFDNWLNQLNQISSFGLKHISLYQLTIEENTLFYSRGIKAMDEEKASQFYLNTEKYLADKSYNKYEVSNYCLSGFASIHNQTYWLGGDYIGIGETAHGRLKIDTKNYAITDPMIMEELTPAERAQELIIMGLRLTKGINKKCFTKICSLDFDAFINQSFKNNMIANGYLSETSTHLKATEQGFLLLNYLIEGLCP